MSVHFASAKRTEEEIPSSKDLAGGLRCLSADVK